MATTRERVREHRQRMREQGLRPVQIWVPDVRAPEFVAEAHRQSAAVAASEQEAADQEFVDALSGLGRRGGPRRVRRGDICVAAARGAYTGKPQPVVIVQDDRFDATASVTVCPLTINDLDAPLLRIPVEPTDTSGIRQPSRIMVDKVTTMPRANLGERVGRLADADLVRLDRALLVFLGLAD